LLAVNYGRLLADSARDRTLDRNTNVYGIFYDRSNSFLKMIYERFLNEEKQQKSKEANSKDFNYTKNILKRIDAVECT
jgi:hypothetical protein